MSHLDVTCRKCCSEKFVDKTLYREHCRNVHKNGYECETCHRVFTRRALLHRHQSVHTGVKDFGCQVCSYATSHKSNLERHYKTHFNPRKNGPIRRSSRVQIPSNSTIAPSPLSLVKPHATSVASSPKRKCRFRVGAGPGGLFPGSSTSTRNIMDKASRQNRSQSQSKVKCEEPSDLLLDLSNGPRPMPIPVHPVLKHQYPVLRTMLGFNNVPKSTHVSSTSPIPEGFKHKKEISHSIESILHRPVPTTVKNEVEGPGQAHANNDTNYCGGYSLSSSSPYKSQLPVVPELTSPSNAFFNPYFHLQQQLYQRMPLSIISAPFYPKANQGEVGFSSETIKKEEKRLEDSRIEANYCQSQNSPFQYPVQCVGYNCLPNNNVLPAVSSLTPTPNPWFYYDYLFRLQYEEWYSRFVALQQVSTTTTEVEKEVQPKPEEVEQIDTGKNESKETVSIDTENTDDMDIEEEGSEEKVERVEAELGDELPEPEGSNCP